MADEAMARGEFENVYFAPAILRKSLPATARGRAEDIVAVLGVGIDDDGDTGKRAVLPPRHSAVVGGNDLPRPTRQSAHPLRFPQAPAGCRRSDVCRAVEPQVWG
jgi:hypothetical protein